LPEASEVDQNPRSSEKGGGARVEMQMNGEPNEQDAEWNRSAASALGRKERDVKEAPDRARS